MKRSSNKSTNKVPIQDVFLSPLYRRGTLVLFLLVSFHEFTGYAYIILYSKKIFKQLGSDSITPKQANYLVGVVNFIATVVSAFVVKRFGRRTLLIPGHVLMGLINIVIAVAVKYNEAIVSVLFILAFLIAYQIFNGPIIWLYISEVPVDTAMGFVTLSLWVSQFIIALIAPFLGDALNPEGCFYLFGGISMVGAVFCYFFVKETRGLTDKEKKLLYAEVGVNKSIKSIRLSKQYQSEH